MNLLKYKLNKISHYLSSNSRHGTHSPFVYKLVDEVIYGKPLTADRVLWDRFLKKESDIERKKKLLLTRLLQNFPYGNFEIISNHKQSLLEEMFSFYKNNWSDRNVFYVEDIEQLDSVFQKSADKDLVIVNELYHNEAAQLKWKSVQQNHSVVVSIDLFHYGLVFFRKEQRKENFKIRFNMKG